MSPWAAAALAVAAAIAALAVLLTRRVRLRASLQARVDEAGTWSAAGGGSVGPLAFTAGASAAGSTWSAHLFGRRLARGKARVARERITLASAVRAVRATPRVLRRLRFESLDARVRGAAADPATSARIAGWIAATSCALFPRARVETDVDWLADSPHAHVDVDAVASLVPLFVVIDLARLAVKGRTPA